MLCLKCQFSLLPSDASAASAGSKGSKAGGHSPAHFPHLGPIEWLSYVEVCTCVCAYISKQGMCNVL